MEGGVFRVVDELRRVGLVQHPHELEGVAVAREGGEGEL